MSSQIPSLPVGPESTRVFVGYKLSALTRDQFFRELGQTFMPGTPYMQAPLGLNAYVPAVLDPEEISEGLTDDTAKALPDEVALIVYESLDVYQLAREQSLRRRMYTHSHAAVFDMAAPGGGGQFPGTSAEPSVREARLCWHLFPNAIDWQRGSTQLLLHAADFDVSGSAELQRQQTEAARPLLQEAGVNQVICVATPDYAVVWIHADSPVDVDELDLIHGSYVFEKRRLTAQAVSMPRLEEDLKEGLTIPGIEITEASMFNFVFDRNPLRA